MDQETQVEIKHYNFSEYVTWERWQSYYQQIESVLRYKPTSVLIIGVGDGIIVGALKEMGIEVKTLDFDSELNPNYVCSVLDIAKCVDRKFDLVLCCQVLEHLPFKEFNQALRGLEEVSHKNVVISLPFRSLRLLNLAFKIQRVKEIFFKIVIPKFYERFKFDGEHYWEIGTRGFSRRQLREELKKVFNIEREFFVRANPYHYFYELKVKS